MNPKGFTLIELLVVIAIIGLLSTIVTASLGSAKAKSRDAKRISDVKTIQTALALYYNDNGMYPRNIYAASTGVPPANGLAPTYVPVVPKDPSASGSTNCNTTSLNSTAGCYHYYALSSSGVCNSSASPPVLYHLGAALENDNNQALNEDVDASQNLTSYGTFAPCTPSAPAGFDGNASACSQGGGAVAPDTCYDLTP